MRLFFFQDLLTPEEVSLSSGHRELLTLKKALLADCLPASSSVVWCTDSANLVSFWEKGSPKHMIQLDIIECLLFCKEGSISLHVLYLPREDPRIQAVDVGSRSFDKEDWGIDDASFSVLQSRFLPNGFSLDPFASTSNARCARFFSRYAFLGSLTTDAFTVDWSNECLFVSPQSASLSLFGKRFTLPSMPWLLSFFLFGNPLHFGRSSFLMDATLPGLPNQSSPSIPPFNWGNFMLV